jgi:hypothetical protein
MNLTLCGSSPVCCRSSLRPLARVKLVAPKDKLIVAGQGWGEGVSPAGIRLIGIAEVLGAIALILPAVTHIASVLVPPGALELALTMVGAAVVHAHRNEYPNIAVDAALLGLAPIFAWNRLGPYSFTA